MMSRKYRDKSDFVWTKSDRALTGYTCEDVKGTLKNLARSLMYINGKYIWDNGNNIWKAGDNSELYIAVSNMKEYLFKKYDSYFGKFVNLKTYLEKHAYR